MRNLVWPASARGERLRRNEEATVRRVLAPVGGVAVITAVVGSLASGGLATTPGKNGLMAYAQELSPQHFQIFTIRPDGSGARQITHAVSAEHPDWSPNGKKIVFELERQKPFRKGIALMSASGTGVRILTPRGIQGQPSFSPAGGSIVYERDIAAGNDSVWIMRADGTHKRRVTRSPFGDTDPNFSPDGKLITFVRVKKEHRQQALFAVRPDGSALRRLTPYSWDVGIKHDWSPDGKLIVLTTNADLARPRGSANLVTIRPNGSGMTRLTRFTGETNNALAGSFSPDGKQIVFRLEQGDKSSLAVVNRDGSHLRSLTKPSADRPRFIDWGPRPTP
jgi:Tol biopolymer transport system component